MYPYTKKIIHDKEILPNVPLIQISQLGFNSHGSLYNKDNVLVHKLLFYFLLQRCMLVKKKYSSVTIINCNFVRADLHS